MDQYITSLYWAFTTMATVGYGDIVPVTNTEKIYVICSEIIAAGVYALTINNISRMVSRYNSLAEEYKERLTYVNRFMKEKNMPEELKIKVRRYLDYVWEGKKEFKIE